MAKPIEELFQLSDHHYGVPPSTPANPYIEISMINKDQIDKCLEGVAQYLVYPLKFGLAPTSEFKDLQDALTRPGKGTGSRPPPVSRNTRFKVHLEEAVEIPLSHLFDPPLHKLGGDQKSSLVVALHTDVNVLCATAMTHQSSKNKSSTSGHLELFNEQELFCALLRALAPAPWIIHQQCETTDETTDESSETDTDVHLPRAKFDLMMNHGYDPTPASANVVIKVNGNSKEKPDPVVTNKTDSSTKLYALNVSAVLEAFIFAEINEEDATRVIIASESYVRPLLRIKSLDYIFTTRSVVRWFDVDEHHNVTFNLEGCILFILLVKCGTLVYPAYEPTEVCKLVTDEYKSNWSAAYSTLKVKYSKNMHQTAPQVTKPSRGVTIDNNNLKTSDVDEVFEKLRKRRRHSSGEGTSS